MATDSWHFASFSLGMFLQAYVFGMATIATGWVRIPPGLRSLLLSWAPLWLIIGLAVMGPLADRIGRQPVFRWNLALYGIGGVGIIFSSNYPLLLASLAVMLFAAGGELNAILIASHEVMPTKHRSKTMMLEINAANLGGVALATMSLLSAGHGVALQRTVVAVAFLVSLGVLIGVRRRTPESVRWLRTRGRDSQAEAVIRRHYGKPEFHARDRAAAAARAPGQVGAKAAPLWLRLWATSATVFAGTAGFGLITYVLGPAHFPHLSAAILLVATITEVVFGMFAFWADRWSRKQLLLMGYGGCFVVSLVIALTEPAWAGSTLLFFPLLILLSIFITVEFLASTTLQGEVWETRRRGTYSAMVRFVSVGLYIATIYLTQGLSLGGFTWFGVLVWGIGLLGALSWYFGGTETGRGASVEAAAGQATP